MKYTLRNTGLDFFDYRRYRHATFFWITLSAMVFSCSRGKTNQEGDRGSDTDSVVETEFVSDSDTDADTDGDTDTDSDGDSDTDVDTDTDTDTDTDVDTDTDGDTNADSDADSDAECDAGQCPSGVAQHAYIKASNAEAGDGFGFVAVDGNTLVVGALGERSNARVSTGDESNNSAGSAGAVVRVRTRRGMWTQAAYLKASQREAGTASARCRDLDGDTLRWGGVGGEQRRGS